MAFLGPLIAGYTIHRAEGTGQDAVQLLQFMQATYQEMHPRGRFKHLEATIADYFSSETPLWFVQPVDQVQRVACLWVGNAVDQLRGDRYTHVMLLYVLPQHRQRGVGTALMTHAANWAQQRGDRQISLQVFESNSAAVQLYQGLGYHTQALVMVKPLDGPLDKPSNR